MTVRVSPRTEAPAVSKVARAQPSHADSPADPFAVHLAKAAEQAPRQKGQVQRKVAPKQGEGKVHRRKAGEEPQKDTPPAEVQADAEVVSVDEEIGETQASVEPVVQEDVEDSAKDDGEVVSPVAASPAPLPLVPAEIRPDPAGVPQPLPVVTSAPVVEGQGEASVENHGNEPSKAVPQQPAPLPSASARPARPQTSRELPEPVVPIPRRADPALEASAEGSDSPESEEPVQSKPVSPVKAERTFHPVPETRQKEPREVEGEPAKTPTAAPQVNPGAVAEAPEVTEAATTISTPVEKDASDRSRPAPMPVSAAPAPLPTPAPASAESARIAQESPAPSSERTFDQIVVGLRTKMDATNQKAQIELNPPNLGRLQVAVEVSNGLLTAQFHASTDVVRDLLSSKMDQLRSVLEGQGIAVDKLAVTSGGNASNVSPTQGSTTSQHDGRSGGAFAQDRQSPRHSGGETFSRLWRAAQENQEPVDLLA